MQQLSPACMQQLRPVSGHTLSYQLTLHELQQLSFGIEGSRQHMPQCSSAEGAAAVQGASTCLRIMHIGSCWAYSCNISHDCQMLLQGPCCTRLALEVASSTNRHSKLAVPGDQPSRRDSGHCCCPLLPMFDLLFGNEGALLSSIAFSFESML
jgi:hypothetical protein